MEQASSEGAPSTSASSPTASGSTVDTSTTDDIFIRHKVRKRDTLAGLAVKYNVAVADIKRANGFQTDTAMFGKDSVLIPTKPLPLGPEYAAWAGMIVAHYGRHGVPGPEGHLRATSAAALSELRGYYSSGPSPDRSPDYSDDEIDIFAPRGRRQPLPGEVELMTRNPSTQSTPGYLEERLRRRRNAEEDGFDEPLDGSSPVRNTSPFRAPLFRSATERLTRDREPNGNRSAGVGLNDLKEWHRKSLQWRSQLLNKLKRAASQPVLAGNGGTGVAQAAEAALALASGLGGSTASLQKQGRKAD